MSAQSAQPGVPGRADPEALLVALILAPGTYSRNKFFGLFESREHRQARRRAQLVRSLIRELTDPWPIKGDVPARPTPLIEEEFERDGMLHLTYRVKDFEYRRSAILSSVEAAALRYALKQAGQGEITEQDRALVERCLGRLAPPNL